MSHHRTKERHCRRLWMLEGALLRGRPDVRGIRLGMSVEKVWNLRQDEVLQMSIFQQRPPFHKHMSSQERRIDPFLSPVFYLWTRGCRARKCFFQKGNAGLKLGDDKSG
jgi:hypothetical protein